MSEQEVALPAWIGFQPSPKLVGGAVAGVSVWMGLMPFVGPLMGMPLDGAVAWQWTLDRVVLHVLPGLLGAVVGLLMLRAAGPRPGSDEAAGPAGRTFTRLGTAALVLGMWMGAGPWLYDTLVPGAGTSGLMFMQVPGWTTMSPLHQLLLESLCHWAPGMVVGALGASASLRVGRPRVSSAAAGRHCGGVS